jgi:mycothiol synthase
VRELWQLSRRLGGDAIGKNPWISTWRHSANASATAYRLDYPDETDYELRTFRPGVDDLAWIAANQAAFAEHPEQGRLTLRDLHARLTEPWFDPSGFFVVVTGEEIVAFCWTKVPIGIENTAGEIYAIGVQPRHRKRGLAAFLLEVGISHLTAFGLKEVTLYVEGDNTTARTIYAEAGFQEVALDVQYEKAK